MPILIGEPVVLPPPLQPGIELGQFTFSLQRPDGTSFALDVPPTISVQAGAQGLDMGTIDIAEDTAAGFDGAQPNQITVEPREVFLPLLLRADNLIGLTNFKRSLMSYVNPAKGPVTIRCALPDGTARLIDGYYRAGIDTTMSTDAWGASWQFVGLTIRCSLQPFWREENDWTVTWQQNDDRTPLLPILPLAPPSSQVLGGTNPITVGGDVQTWPVWQVVGPLEAVTVQDVATGLSWTLTASLGPDDVWTVDTRPGQKGVFDTAGNRQRGALGAGDALFPIQPYFSEIETSVSGASTGASVTGTAPVLWQSA